jgi:lysophospholipase L1-like esterase
MRFLDRYPPRLRYALSLAGWSILFLVLLELLIRLLIFKAPPLEINPAWGTAPVAGSSYTRGTEGFGVTHFLAGGEIRTPFQQGRSVVVLGDSYTQALQVQDEQKYVSVAEQILHERGLAADLHNLGDAGRSLADYVYAAPYVIETYAPQVVVVQISAGDFAEALRPGSENRFALAEDGSAALVHTPKNPHLFWQNLLRSSGLFSLLADRVLQMQKAPAQASKPAQESGAAVGVAAQIAVLQAAYPDIPLCFLLIPATPKIEAGQVTWYSPGDIYIVQQLAAHENTCLVYPVAEFEELYQQGIFPTGFFNTLPAKGHLNPAGHRALGVALADRLEELLNETLK